MSYRNQYDNFSCVPIAVYNALVSMGVKEFGTHRLSKSFWLLSTMCGTDEEGTPVHSIEATLSYLGVLCGFNFKYREVKTAKDIKKHTCSILISLVDGELHCYLAYPQHGHIHLINYAEKKTKMDEKSFVNLVIKNGKKEGHPVTGFLIDKWD